MVNTGPAAGIPHTPPLNGPVALITPTDYGFFSALESVIMINSINYVIGPMLSQRPLLTPLLIAGLLGLGGCLGTAPDGQVSGAIDPGSNDASVPMWIWRGGSAADDFGRGVTVLPGGDVVVTGRSGGDYQGEFNHGRPGVLAEDDDILVSRIGPDGTSRWHRLHGTGLDDIGNAVVADGASNLYLGITSNGNFDGHINAGGEDGFVVKLNSNGLIQWSIPFSTSGNDSVTDLLLSGSTLYAVGYTRGNLHGNTLIGVDGWADIFIASIDTTTGTRTWTRTLGTAGTDLPAAISIHSTGKLLVTGHTWGNLDGNLNLGNTDLFVSKIDIASGIADWTRTIGGADFDYGRDVLADGTGNVYVTGSVAANAVVVKYNTAGTWQWQQEIAASKPGSEGRSLGLYGTDLLVAGDTVAETLDGLVTPGSSDIFVVTLGADGSLYSSELYGSSDVDYLQDMVVSSGGVYLAGSASGQPYATQGAGFLDALVLRIR